jgi:phage terminase large subunit GpA-like protein
VKFVGSNSIADVKSTSARRLIVEEPDDCNQNLRGQGDSIKLIEERGKSFRDAKVLIGGTPSVKGVSSIDDEYDHSDRCEWHVPVPIAASSRRSNGNRFDGSRTRPRIIRSSVTALPETARYVSARIVVPCGTTRRRTRRSRRARGFASAFSRRGRARDQ